MIMTCKTCKHAEFRRGPTGRIKTSLHGECKVPFTLPPVPYAVIVQHRRVVIWTNTGKDCPTYEPIK